MVDERKWKAHLWNKCSMFLKQYAAKIGVIILDNNVQGN
jgi:hypothetical protein